MGWGDAEDTTKNLPNRRASRADPILAALRAGRRISMSSRVSMAPRPAVKRVLKWKPKPPPPPPSVVQQEDLAPLKLDDGVTGQMASSTTKRRHSRINALFGQLANARGSSAKLESVADRRREEKHEREERKKWQADEAVEAALRDGTMARLERQEEADATRQKIEDEEAAHRAKASAAATTSAGGSLASKAKAVWTRKSTAAKRKEPQPEEDWTVLVQRQPELAC